MLSMFCAPIKPPVRLSPLFGHLTQELSAISGLDSLVNPELEIPAAWMKLAAWQYIRSQYRIKGEIQPTTERPTWEIENPPTHGHKAKAKREIWFQANTNPTQFAHWR